jgi:5-methylcytosine-specific restriction endonuclease McrA
MTDIHRMNVVSARRTGNYAKVRINTPEILRTKKAAYYQRRKDDPEFKAKRAKNSERYRDIRGGHRRGKKQKRKPSTVLQRQQDALRKRLKRQENLEATRQYGRIARAIRRALENKADGFFTKDDVERIFKAQKGKCAYFMICGHYLGDDYHIDHIVALSKGGTNWPRNIQLTCVECNCSKGAKAPTEFSQQRGLLL